MALSCSFISENEGVLFLLTLSGSDANSKTSSSSFNELNVGEKAALVHEQVNNAGAEAHQTQARKLRGLYSSR
ncbi:hypothetical protein [Salmonella enterica]|uniref:hypothetical protein n=1 Tax=Salmonella enterica TaxID=28901 RepID=UPI003C6F3D88